MKYKILIVDDEPSNLRVLKRLLSVDYATFTAESGAEALELLLQHDFAVIISDQRMPAMTGIDFLKQAAGLRQQMVRILLTGYTDVDTLVEAINSGVVYQYVTKPWNNDDLLQIIKRGLQHFETIKQSHRAQLDISRMKRKVESLQAGMMRLWGEAIRFKSSELLPHAERIGRYATSIATLLQMDERLVSTIGSATFVFPYTYCETVVADSIAPLPILESDRAERSASLAESLALFDALAPLDEYSEIADILRFANENFDGSGYPNQLSGDRIPLASRILAAVRAYDLLTSMPLPDYQLSHDQAITRMNEKLAGRFDPRIIELMTRFAFVNQLPEMVRTHRPEASPIDPGAAWQM